MNLEELYKSFTTDKDVRELLMQSHWLASFAEFDPKTGDTLPMPLNEMLRRISGRECCPYVKDRLWLLSEHSRESAIRLMKGLSEEPRRESAYLPIRDVRELDTASFIALSRRPGRNIREKLADKPYMQAVRHFQSIDVPENRLLKSYLVQLAEAFELRKKYLEDKTIDDYLQAIYRWLYSDEAQEIARWENLAPNNALISHRDYRRIWNSWCLLQSLSDDVERDLCHIQERRATKARWEKLGKQYASGQAVYADMPVLIDYNSFSIKPWDEALPTTRLGVPPKRAEWYETREPACVDLTQPQPVFATPSTTGALHDSFFWQRWKSDETFVDIELFESDAGYAHPDATTVTDSDMFFSGRERSGALNQASRSFAQRLKKHFRNGRLIWLMPDSLSEFDLDLVRQNLNAAFSNAEPLPCSVAAVFKHVSYEQITHDGYKVGVIERINGKAYETEMVACFNEDLLDELPETRGYVWEKGASKLISSDVEIEAVRGRMPLLLRDGSWTLDCNPYGVSHANNEDVVMQLDGYDCAIWLSGRPVEGGIKLYELQRRSPNTMLWRNHIPELMTKMLIGNEYKPFVFVGSDVTIRPIRGVAVKIDVPQEFTLSKGKKSFRLPLLQGSSGQALEYEAKLVSRDFPYSEDVRCRLNMTYTYGADDPYKLVFEPLNKEYKPINVIWQLKEDVVIDDAPAPGYPTPGTWADVQHDKNPRKQVYEDLTAKAITASRRLVESLSLLDAKVVRGRLTCDWKRDKRDQRYAFVSRPGGKDLFMHENALAYGYNGSHLEMYDEVFYVVEVWKGRESAKFVSPEENWTREAIPKSASYFIYSSMYVPYLRIWADGRSCADVECPDRFRKEIFKYSSKIYDYINSESTPNKLRSDLVFLLCCMGKDVPADMVPYIESLVRSHDISDKSLGVVLGDLSTPWQRRILALALSRVDGVSLRAFAHAIWRHESFVRVFSHSDLEVVLNSLAETIEKDSEKLIQGWEPGKREWNVRNMTRYLELLLGLLRTRESEDDEIRMVLQPGQEFTVRFAKQINLLIKDAIENKDDYFSRVQFDVSLKPSDDLTPNLLYVLRAYLEGDIAANAIRVTGIVEEEKEE